MKIAQVLLSLDMGGQEVMALNLARELARRGHDVTVVSMSEGGSLRGEFSPFPIVDAFRKAGSGIDPNAWPTLFRAFRQIRPDVPVLIMNSYNEQDTPAETGPGPAAAFLHKPFSLLTLRDRLHEVLGSVPDRRGE